jgi:translation initiation factor 2 alpha subunit (eIF-2alpha)
MRKAIRRAIKINAEEVVRVVTVDKEKGISYLI